MTVNRSVSISKVLTIAPVTMAINYKMASVRTLMNVLMHRRVTNSVTMCQDPSSVTVTMVTNWHAMNIHVGTSTSVSTTLGVSTTAPTPPVIITAAVGWGTSWNKMDTLVVISMSVDWAFTPATSSVSILLAALYVPVEMVLC